MAYFKISTDKKGKLKAKIQALGRDPQTDKQKVCYKTVKNDNDLKHVSCHGLRHTYCSILLSQNVPIQTVSRYMGHSDSTVTLQVYSHFIPDTQEKALTALDKLS